MKLFKNVCCSREARVLSPIEALFEAHSIATQREKTEKWPQKARFVGQQGIFKQLLCMFIFIMVKENPIGVADSPFLNKMLKK